MFSTIISLISIILMSSKTWRKELNQDWKKMLFRRFFGRNWVLFQNYSRNFRVCSNMPHLWDLNRIIRFHLDNTLIAFSNNEMFCLLSLLKSPLNIRFKNRPVEASKEHLNPAFCFIKTRHFWDDHSQKMET